MLEDSQDFTIPSSRRPTTRPNGDLATVAVGCGVLGMCIPYLGLVASALGIIQLCRIRRSPTRYGGRTRAYVAVTIGILGAVLMTAFDIFRMDAPTETSKRLVCASNLKSFGRSLRAYASENEAQYPGELQFLPDVGQATRKQFICPSDAKTASVSPGSSYIYIPGQSLNSDVRNVLIYEPERNHAGEGGNVLFVDGHVEFITPYAEVERLVAETKERLRQEISAGP